MVGDRLKQFMNALSLTQQSVSDSIGISRPYVSQLISGKYEVTKTIALALKAEFNVNPTWLLTGEGEMFLTSPPGPLSPGRGGENQTGKVMQSDAGSEKKNGHLTGINGNVKEYPDIDDSDQIARTAWYRNLPDNNQWMINAMDELRDDEAVRMCKKIANAAIVLQRARAEAEKMPDNETEQDLRKKGEAG